VSRKTRGVDREVDRHRAGHAAERGQHGDRQPSALAQLAEVELALGLQPDDEEEERHQALVHPAAQVGGEHVVAEREREPRAPHGLVGRGRDVRPQQRGDDRRDEHRRAAFLGAEEVADRRGQVARPRRSPRRGAVRVRTFGRAHVDGEHRSWAGG
jgi:hypothetical protein